jgi:type IV secretory pathway component VirB8
VYTIFLHKTGQPWLQKMKEDGITSNVKILTVNEIDDAVWQVEYSVDYYLPAERTPTTKKFRATLGIQYRAQTVQYKERLKNPVGFKVIEYGLKDLSDDRTEAKQ